MSMKRVEQQHSQGCFYAGVATLLGISYEDAFKRIHPLESIDRLHSYPLVRADTIEEVLSKLGIKYRVSNARRVRALRHNALLVIRWRYDPNFSHTLVWDANKRKVIDPGFRLNMPIKDIEDQLYKVLYIK